MTDKEIFIKEMQSRVKNFAVSIIKFSESFEKTKATAIISNQIIKSASSAGANYRAACRARSRQEFFSKMCIVVEECDETEYWLEIIQNISLSKQKDILEELKTEASELTKIMTKSKNTVYNTIKK